MIQWEDLYKVVAAMVPLYVSLTLGYGSVKWWRIFTAEQCDGINRLVCYFILPLLSFQFTAAQANILKMNYLVLATDAISKLIAVLAIAFWTKFISKETNYSWSITSLALCTFSNLLIVGLPVLQSMYGQIGVDLIIQLCVVQTTVWSPILILFLEFWKLKMNRALPQDTSKQIASSTVELGTTSPSQHVEKDIETTDNGLATTENTDVSRPSLLSITRIVGAKLAFNPNVFSCVIGVIWAVLAQRFNFTMPGIMEGSIDILAKAGTGTAMFNIGIFIAMQRKVIACGTGPTALAMVLRFVFAPTATALGALAIGLHGDVFRITIIQAALPQAIATFVFAKEYGLHANVLSTAVVFGTLISLPVLVAYYAILGVVKI